MNNGDEYTRESIVDLGNGHSFRLGDLSTPELLRKYRKQKKKPSRVNAKFLNYVESNLQRLYNSAKFSNRTDIMQSIVALGFVPKKKTKQELFEEICSSKKRVYLSQKDAKQSLKAMRTVEQRHKKPIRSYQCEECGFWHVTSIPIEKWKEMQKEKRPR